MGIIVEYHFRVICAPAGAQWGSEPGGVDKTNAVGLHPTDLWSSEKVAKFIMGQFLVVSD